MLALIPASCLTIWVVIALEALSYPVQAQFSRNSTTHAVKQIYDIPSNTPVRLEQLRDLLQDDNAAACLLNLILVVDADL